METLNVHADLVQRIKLYAERRQESVELFLSRLLDQERLLSAEATNHSSQPVITTDGVAMDAAAPQSHHRSGAMYHSPPPPGKEVEHSVVLVQPFQLLFEAAPVAILLIDEAGKILLANAQIEAMFGYLRQELVGMPVEILLPRHLRDKHAALRVDYGSHPEFLPLGIGRDLVGGRKDGTEFPVEIGLSYIATENGLMILAFAADISERKRMEETFHENVERYRIISNLMSDYAAAYHYLSDDNDQAQLEWVIGAFEPITGHSLADASSNFSLSQPVIPEDLPIFEARQRKLRAGQSDVSEYRIRNKQGELRWVRSYGFPEWDAEKQRVVRVHVGVRDITERRWAEEAYVTLVQNSLQGLAIYQDGRNVFVNTRLCEMLGYTAEELYAIEDPVATYVHPDNQVWIIAEFNRLMDEGGKSDQEIHLLHKDGEERWLRALSTRVVYRGKPAIQVALFDVTEQRRAEQSSAHAAAIIHSSNDAIISKSLAGTIVSWNPGAEHMYGYAAAEMIGQPASLLIPPERRGETDRILRDIRRGSTVKYCETVHRHKDGHLLNVSLTMSPIRDSHGEVTGVSVIAQDITERIQAAIALRKSEGRLKQAMNIAHLGVWDWDIITDQTVWAGEIFRMYGITPEEFTGKGEDYLNFTLPEDRQKQQDNLGRAFAQGITEKSLTNLDNLDVTIPYQPRDFRILRRDGTICHVQGDAIAIVDDDGHPLRMLGILQDVTEQKLAEEELRLYREQLERLVNERTAELEAITRRLRHEIMERQEAQEALLAEKQHTEMILTHVADGVMSTDVQGNILYVNPAWEQLTGYTVAEVKGRNPRFLQSGYSKRSNYKDMWETIMRGDVWTGLFINRHKDGSNFDTLETIVPVKNAQGEITHFVSVWRDVTKEQKLATMKEEFIANAAHDLNNPITVLYTTLYLLKRDPAQLERRLALFEDQIALLQSLVDDLLTVSRLERRLMPPTFKLVDLNAIIAKVVEPQALLAANKALTLICSNPLTDPLFIYGDPELLTRVVVNLVANAVNYTPYGGCVTITSYREGSSAVFVVDDTGIGISAHDLPHIFDRFYRSDSARRAGQGTGLGLAIVKEIVDLHQGTIDVKSVTNEGTRFRVLLPIETQLTL